MKKKRSCDKVRDTALVALLGALHFVGDADSIGSNAVAITLDLIAPGPALASLS